MMRSLLFFFIIGLILPFSPQASAVSNPWLRTCRVDAGQFWVLKSSVGELSLCFFGDYAVGAEAFFLFKTRAGVADAIQAYKNRNSSSSRGGVCGSFGAEVVEGKDTAGQTFNVCRFSDQSLIEETTLWLGAGAAGSERLDEALSKTY
ncbi:MAG: hypothetical protein AAGB31_11170 [Bdellovibrio sp.]